jgi:uncharacterized protein
MKQKTLIKGIIFLIFLKIIISSTFGQEIKLGFEVSIESNVLNENRSFLVRLPNNYDNSKKSYPVLYRLDGDLDLFIETAGVIHRLAYMEEVIPEMIVVLIENTNRNRDMMPMKTNFLESEVGAENFKNFIEKELIPHIDNTYRTTKERLLCGQSLSAIFTLYHFLTSQESFNSYIVCSGGFLDREDYFIGLTKEMLKSEKEKVRIIFLTHGLTDFLDAEGMMKKQLENFDKMLEPDEKIISKLKIYEEEGHVPYQSLYHGLKFIYEKN